MKFILPLVVLTALPTVTWAQSHGEHGTSPYAGQETREIKSLSEEDIAELRNGSGWGLAKAAELNGVPGPAHLLEFKDEIALTPKQVVAIEAIHAKIKQDAIAEGERLIALERSLEEQFRDRKMTKENLRDTLASIEQSRSKLRYIHLEAHLTTPPLLTSEQIARYNSLRGYASNPCDAVPAGHDPVMWRKHNSCN